MNETRWREAKLIQLICFLATYFKLQKNFVIMHITSISRFDKNQLFSKYVKSGDTEQHVYPDII